MTGTTAAPQPAPEALPATPITSRSDFQACIRAAFDELAASAADCGELWLADADFALWPLGERAVVDALTRWSQQRPHGRLHLLAANFDAIGRLHPRWVAWRRQWAHQVDCRANTEVEPSRLPRLLIAPGRFSLRLIDPVRCNGRWARAPADMARDREALDAVLQQSQPAFGATVTGL